MPWTLPKATHTLRRRLYNKYFYMGVGIDVSPNFRTLPMVSRNINVAKWGKVSMAKLQRSYRLIRTSPSLPHLSFQTPSWESNSELSWKFALCFDSWVPSSLTVSTPSTTSPLGPYKNACCVLSSLSYTCAEILRVKQKITCHTEQGNPSYVFYIQVILPKGLLLFLGTGFVTITLLLPMHIQWKY